MKNEQAKNRRELLARILPQVLDNVNTLEDAVAAVKRVGGLRHAMSVAIGALTYAPDDYRAKVELLLDAIPPISWDGFCASRGFVGILLYLRGGNHVAFRHRHLLEEYFESSLDLYLSPAFNFVGVNDNTSAMIMTYLFLLDECFGNSAAKATAYRRLEQLERLLADRDCPSEYHSPTYIAITVHALAALANLSQDSALRTRARHLESALWHSVLLAFDRQAGTIMGPYSRAYENGVRGENSQMRILYDVILGDRLRIRPFLNDCCPAHKEGELLSEGAMLAAEDYHASAADVRHALERPFPCRVSLTAETAPAADAPLLPDCPQDEIAMLKADPSPLFLSEDLTEYAPGVSHLFTAFHDGYSLGTASRDWHNGLQSHGFFSIVKRPIVRAQQDIATVFSSFAVNEEGLDAPDPVDYGRKMAFQSDRTAMVLYSPKLITNKIRSLVLRVFFSNPEHTVLEIRCGHRPLKPGDRFLFTSAPITVSFGNVYAALIPLTEGGECRIENHHGYLTVAMVGYEGEERHMTKKELKLARFGFIFSLANREEAGSFDEFCRRSEKYVLKDELVANHHTRYAFERHVKYECCKESLECAVSPVSEGIRFMRAMGKRLV